MISAALTTANYLAWRGGVRCFVRLGPTNESAIFDRESAREGGRRGGSVVLPPPYNTGTRPLLVRSFSLPFLLFGVLIKGLKDQD